MPISTRICESIYLLMGSKYVTEIERSLCTEFCFCFLMKHQDGAERIVSQALLTATRHITLYRASDYTIIAATAMYYII